MIDASRLPVLLVGASCRAAAAALHHLRLPVEAWDLFADQDTHHFGTVHQIEAIEISQLADLLERQRSWLLPCGGLENAVDLWQALERQHNVLGPSCAQLKHLRDPFWLRDLCIAHQLPIQVPVSVDAEPTQWSQTRWLRKNRSSAGGLRVSFADDEAATWHLTREDTYWQEFVAGVEVSVTVCIQPTRSYLLSAMLSFPRDNSVSSDSHCVAFQYQGSIGPVELPLGVVQAISEFFLRLGKELDFSGVLQADFILRDQSVFLLEVNPRWTASMELAETKQPGSILSCFQTHGGQRMPMPLSPSTPTCMFDQPMMAKRICYAHQSFPITSRYSEQLLQRSVWKKLSRMPIQQMTELDNLYQDSMAVEHVHRKAQFMEADWSFRLADIPQPNTWIEKGQPICSLLIQASGLIEQICQAQAMQDGLEFERQASVWQNLMHAVAASLEEEYRDPKN